MAPVRSRLWLAVKDAATVAVFAAILLAALVFVTCAAIITVRVLWGLL